MFGGKPLGHGPTERVRFRRHGRRSGRKEGQAGGLEIWRQAVQGNGPEGGMNWLPVGENGQERQGEVLQMERATGTRGQS